MLTKNEEIELKYLQVKGFKWIVRLENGRLEAYKEKPNRDKRGACYGTWVIGEYPIKDFSLFTDLELGEYKFLKWEDEPMDINKILAEDGWDIPLVEPK